MRKEGGRTSRRSRACEWRHKSSTAPHPRTLHSRRTWPPPRRPPRPRIRKIEHRGSKRWRKRQQALQRRLRPPHCCRPKCALTRGAVVAQTSTSHPRHSTACPGLDVARDEPTRGAELVSSAWPLKLPSPHLYTCAFSHLLCVCFETEAAGRVDTALALFSAGFPSLCCLHRAYGPLRLQQSPP